MAQIYLIQMTSEKPFYFAFKTRIENGNGDVNAWWHGVFQLADRDFPKSLLIGSIALFFNPVSTSSLKKKKKVQRLLQNW